MRPKLKELRGRPAAVTPSTALPPLPKREVYRKPDRLEDYMFVADFRADRTLALDGKFAGHAGETLKIMVQTGESGRSRSRTFTLRSTRTAFSTWLARYPITRMP